MQIHFEGYISLATLAAVLGLYGKLYLMNWKFNRMWRDYEVRHGMNGQGKKADAHHA